MVATGHVHHSGSGLYYFPHGKNAVGVNLFGCQPGSFPAMLSMENRTAREWFSSFWGAFDELPDVDFDEFFARALEKSIKALIYIGPPPWRYFPSRYQFLDAGRFDLIAGASDVFDPACRYWFPLNRTQKSRISFVRPDRTMQFVTPEAQQTAVSGFGLDDWSLLKQWIEEFPSNAPAMPVDAWNEISKTLQRKFSISDQVTAMDSVYWTPFTTHLTSGLDKNLDPFEFSGLFFLETGVSTASHPSKNTVLLMPRLKSSSSADLSQHMSRDALDVTVHPSMVEGPNRNPRGCIRFQGREFQIRLHVSEKIPASCAVLELPEDHDWRLYIDAWSNTLTGELIL